MVPIEPAGPAGSNGTGFSFCTQKEMLDSQNICAWLYTPPGPWLFPWRSRSAVPAPWNEMCRRNGSLKHKRRSFGIWGPCSLQNIPNFVCTQNFGYKTLVFGFIEPLRRHVCGWLGLAGASRRESGPGWVSSRHDGIRAVRNQRSSRTTTGVS